MIWKTAEPSTTKRMKPMTMGLMAEDEASSFFCNHQTRCCALRELRMDDERSSSCSY